MQKLKKRHFIFYDRRGSLKLLENQPKEGFESKEDSKKYLSELVSRNTVGNTIKFFIIESIS